MNNQNYSIEDASESLKLFLNYMKESMEVIFKLEVSSFDSRKYLIEDSNRDKSKDSEYQWILYNIRNEENNIL